MLATIRSSISEVFISYARSTGDQAQQIAEALQALGYDVWRDDSLPAHRDYAEVIEERLRARLQKSHRRRSHRRILTVASKRTPPEIVGANPGTS